MNSSELYSTAEEMNEQSYYSTDLGNNYFHVNINVENTDPVPWYTNPANEAYSGEVTTSGTYAVRKVAFDLEGREWWCIEVDGNARWIPGDENAKVSITDYSTYAYDVMSSEGYQTAKQKAIDTANRVYQKIYDKILESGDPLADVVKDEYTTTSGDSYTLVQRVITHQNVYANYQAYGLFLNRVFGMPPQWNTYTDPPVTLGSAILGRRYSTIILSNPTIISMCPGEMIFSASVMENLGTIVSAGASSNDIIDAFTNNGSDMLWKFEQRWEAKEGGYLSYVNALCQYIVLALSNQEDSAVIADPTSSRNIPLKDRVMPRALQQFQSDNRIYQDIELEALLGSNIVQTSAGPIPKVATNGFITAFANIGISFLNALPKLVIDSAKTIGSSVGNALKNNFVHFAVNGQVSVRESFSTETRASTIETTISGLTNDIMKDVAFMSGIAYTDEEAASDLETLKSKAKEMFGGGLFHLISNAFECLKGGNMSWPQVVDSVSWGRDYNFSVRFVSAYGDVESRFLNVLLPYVCLMCLWLPKQLKASMDMYRLPFVVQAYAKGIFACPAGVLTNIEVIRGGDEETGWTGGGHPTEMTVNFAIKPLHMKLMMSENDPFFVKNVGLTNYLGTICGVDYTMPQIDLIKQTVQVMAKNWLDNTPTRLEASVSEFFHDNAFVKFINAVVEVFD